MHTCTGACFMCWSIASCNNKSIVINVGGITYQNYGNAGLMGQMSGNMSGFNFSQPQQQEGMHNNYTVHVVSHLVDSIIQKSIYVVGTN